jgi:4'-phosphopantetheinyl transferase EntD
VTGETSFPGFAGDDQPLSPSHAHAAPPGPQRGLHCLADLLPPDAVSVEAWNDDQAAPLFPEERAHLGNAVESRLKEFSTSRSLARQALSRLGLPPAPIRRGSAGEPIWPSGVVGSITHCTGYRAAAVARRTHLSTLGIDAEIDDRLPPEAVESILVAEEIAWIASAPNGRHWDRVLFSAKESVYKAWFPLTHCWLDFTGVAVAIDAAAGAYRVRPRGNLPEGFAPILQQLSGRFLVRSGIILTAAFLPQEAWSGQFQAGA